MHLPYGRPRLFEIHDQPWCPEWLREPIRDMLAYLWVTRIPPFQARAPFEAVAEIMQGLVDELDAEGGEPVTIIDCCSGAGEPWSAIGKRLNSRRSHRPVKILLSDLHPDVPTWQRLAAKSSGSLSYLPYPVDATRAPAALKAHRHVRTFCSSFHHFSEDGARLVLEDAMRTAEGIGIFELQAPDLGSVLTILALFPLSLLLTPFQRPTWRTLALMYILPLIPLVLVVDGIVSAYRTRSPEHIRHLADLAAVGVAVEGGEKHFSEWTFESGRSCHTRPFGHMVWTVGRKDPVRAAT